MTNRARLVLIIFILFASTALTVTYTSAERAGERYFPETGHTVRGDFLVFYESASDPIELYGYPITEAFQNQTTGRIVQYFQRAHFELHSDNPPELRVQLSLLGEILYTPGTALSIPPNYPACRYFSETKHQVCYAFLDFFNANGGIAQFGYPISEIELHNERMVQYFQQARFEWRPELPSGQRVVLSDLGRIYFDLRNENPSRLLPVDYDYIPRSILSLNVRAFFSQAVTPLESDQTVYVVVQDQNLSPISNAQVVINFRFPSGRMATNVMPLTDEFGISYLTFKFEESDVGVVEVEVEANYDRLEKLTRASFRLWW